MKLFHVVDDAASGFSIQVIKLISAGICGVQSAKSAGNVARK
jgi:hypothetical protein